MLVCPLSSPSRLCFDTSVPHGRRWMCPFSSRFVHTLATNAGVHPEIPLASIPAK